MPVQFDPDLSNIPDGFVYYFDGDSLLLNKEGALLLLVRENVEEGGNTGGITLWF